MSYNKIEPAQPTCPEGWTEYEGACYDISSSQSRNRADAITYCAAQAEGATLAILDSQPKVEFAASVARQFFGNSLFERFWVAGHYDVTTKKYFWDDNQGENIYILNVKRNTNTFTFISSYGSKIILYCVRGC